VSFFGHLKPKVHESLDQLVSRQQMRFAVLLRRERLSQAYTQRQLAEVAGIGYTTLRALERDAAGTIETLLRVMGVLGIADGLFVGLPSRHGPLPSRIRPRRKKRRVGHA
jgi:transcriptional regulator with XRE-family HTH domain